MKEKFFFVDFITKNETEDEWKMVLVEESSWDGDISKHLYRIQDRLFECIDAVLDGQLADKFSSSKGKKIVIQIDCYNAPIEPIREFFQSFSSQVLLLPDYKNALKNNPYVSSICFSINFESK